MSPASINSLHRATTGVQPVDRAVASVDTAPTFAANGTLIQPAEPSNATRRTPGRIPALDFTKGALVLIMVLYHWLNYFVSPSGAWYKYLRFLTPSFIFITGFFVSNIYLAKYNTRDSRLPKRLLSRGLKLVAIFVSLNAAIGLLFPRGGAASLTNWPVYVTGNAIDGRAAFSVLLPIGYLLVLSAGLVVVSKIYRNIFHAVCAVMLLLAFLASFYGPKNAYFELVAIGLLGVSIGYVPMDKVERIVHHPFVLLVLYAGYLFAITLWDELFALQIVGVCLSLALIYVLGERKGEPEFIWKTVILLGQYSLFGYIAQIVILQILRRILQHRSSGLVPEVMALIAGVFLTYLGVQLLDSARKRASIVNKLYSAVFA